MKSFNLLLFLVIICTYSFAQDSSQSKAIRYKILKKNGVVLIGEIIEKQIDQPYKIALDNGTIIDITESEIYRMKPIIKSFRQNTIYPPASYTWGFSAEVMGLNNGAFHIGNSPFATGASMALNRYFGAHLMIGAGVGMYNFDLETRRMVVPVFVEAKLRALKNNSSPVIQVRSGYGSAMNSFIDGIVEKKGGMFYNPFFGYEFGINNKISWTMGVGVVLQKAYYAYTQGSTFVDEDIRFRRTEFKLGISIH